jgi:2-(1,2-epoxy-1,2-dihydrophenyl)acetyl-CoA isomerase
MSSQRQDGIAWTIAGGIGRITLDAPERANSIGLAAALAITRAIDEVLAAAPRAVLLTGTGKIFCAGGDIPAMSGAGDGIAAMIEEVLAPLHPAIERLALASVPVVSALNGALGGAGIGLALCADFVLAAPSAKLRTGYAAIGLSPDAGASYFLARRIGAERAKQLFFLSDALDAQRCLELGIYDAVHAEAELPAAAEALLGRLAASASGSLARIKHLCHGMETRSLREHLDLERDYLLESSRSVDSREGLRAFLERRAPRFAGQPG